MEASLNTQIRIEKTKKLTPLPEERLGWWSSKNFDRGGVMRDLVMVLVNDGRTKVLLKTGSNISAFSK